MLVRIQGRVILAIFRRRRGCSLSCVPVLSSCDILSVLEKLSLDLYPVYFYRNLWDAELEDEGNAQEGGFG